MKRSIAAAHQEADSKIPWDQFPPDPTNLMAVEQISIQTPREGASTAVAYFANGSYTTLVRNGDEWAYDDGHGNVSTFASVQAAAYFAAAYTKALPRDITSCLEPSSSSSSS